MNTTSSQQPDWFVQAQQQGLVPKEAQLPEDHSRPWPVVLLTAFGAWVAGLPLLGVLAVLFYDLLRHGPGIAIAGGLMVLGALALLRSKELPLFFEQFAVPMLWAGTAALGFGMERYVAWPTIMLLLALVVAGQAMLLPGASRAWLRLLLGAACMTLLLFVLSPWRWRWSYDEMKDAWLALSPWMAVHLLAAAWLAWAWFKQRASAQGTLSAWGLSLEPFALGWAIAVLGNLAWQSGQTFLIPVGGMGSSVDGGLVRDIATEFAPRGLPLRAIVFKTISCALTVGAVALLARYFRQLQQGTKPTGPVSTAAFAVGAVFVVLAWFMPSLGAALLLAVVALYTHRYRLAVLGAVVAVWIIGGFYYSLAWPLANKAVLMAVAGALLAALAWWAQRSHARAAQAANASTSVLTRAWLAPALVLAAGVLTVLVAMGAIWQKEQLIAQGKPVFVRLAPVDPRSLMQGDYMALRFAMPRDNNREANNRSGNNPNADTPEFDMSAHLSGAQRPLAAGNISSQGVVTLTRIITPGQSPKAGEIAIELTPKNGDWVLVSDAWFFAEGQAKRWEAARYGEFRVLPSGKALLVGMADEALKPIKPD
jgi:uncharacterized membrane-anchored protein